MTEMEEFYSELATGRQDFPDIQWCIHYLTESAPITGVGAENIDWYHKYDFVA